MPDINDTPTEPKIRFRVVNTPTNLDGYWEFNNASSDDNEWQQFGKVEKFIKITSFDDASNVYEDNTLYIDENNKCAIYFSEDGLHYITVDINTINTINEETLSTDIPTVNALTGYILNKNFVQQINNNLPNLNGIITGFVQNIYNQTPDVNGKITGVIMKVNGNSPDETGNVTITIPSGGTKFALVESLDTKPTDLTEDTMYIDLNTNQCALYATNGNWYDVSIKAVNEITTNTTNDNRDVPTINASKNYFIHSVNNLTADTNGNINITIPENETNFIVVNSLSTKPTNPIDDTLYLSEANGQCALHISGNIWYDVNVLSLNTLTSSTTASSLINAEGIRNYVINSISEKADKTELFSGSYNDLTNKPTIPSIEGLASETYVINSISGKADKTELFSGSYNDLTNLPILFSGNYNDLTNLPTLFSGSYNDLTDKPVIPSIDGLATETYVNNKVSNLVSSVNNIIPTNGNVNIPTTNDLTTAVSSDFVLANAISGYINNQNFIKTIYNLTPDSTGKLTGTVLTVNGNSPDSNGNVIISTSDTTKFILATSLTTKPTNPVQDSLYIDTTTKQCSLYATDNTWYDVSIEVVEVIDESTDNDNCIPTVDAVKSYVKNICLFENIDFDTTISNMSWNSKILTCTHNLNYQYPSVEIYLKTINTSSNSTFEIISVPITLIENNLNQLILDFSSITLSSNNKITIKIFK